MSNEGIKLYWLLFHYVQVGIFQFYAAKKISQLAYHVLRKKNPAESMRFLPKSDVLHSMLIDYSIGIVAIALLTYGYYTNNKTYYLSGKYFSIAGFLFTGLIVDLIKYNKIKKLIPAITKRSASLQTRSLGKIIPLWIWGLYVIVCSAVVIVTESSKLKYTLALACIILTTSGLYIEKRAKLPIRSQEDEAYRKCEAWFTVLVAWSIPLIATMRDHLSSTGIDAIVSTVPFILFLLFLNSSIYKKITT